MKFKILTLIAIASLMTGCQWAKVVRETDLQNKTHKDDFSINSFWSKISLEEISRKSEFNLDGSSAESGVASASGESQADQFIQAWGALGSQIMSGAISFPPAARSPDGSGFVTESQLIEIVRELQRED